jgi:hypothetical protein
MSRPLPIPGWLPCENGSTGLSFHVKSGVLSLLHNGSVLLDRLLRPLDELLVTSLPLARLRASLGYILQSASSLAFPSGHCFPLRAAAFRYKPAHEVSFICPSQNISQQSLHAVLSTHRMTAGLDRSAPFPYLAAGRFPHSPGIGLHRLAHSPDLRLDVGGLPHRFLN